MKTWLVVLSGNPGFADSQRRMRSFRPGVHDVTGDLETLAWVDRARSPQLVLVEGETPPLVNVVAPDGESLRPEHIKIPHDGRLVLAEPDVAQEIAETDSVLAAGRDAFPCRCGRAYPSKPALLRHQEVSCPDRTAASAEAAPLDPEPEPVPEPALTDA